MMSIIKERTHKRENCIPRHIRFVGKQLVNSCNRPGGRGCERSAAVSLIMVRHIIGRWGPHAIMAAMPWAGRRTSRAVAIGMAFIALIPLSCSAQKGDNSQPLAWGSCTDRVDTDELPTAQCTTASDPLNWNDAANPAAPQAQLAVMRIPASGERIGVLFANPGGPGASAVGFLERFATNFADSELSRRFDIVGFDPRGIGFSTPELRCRTDAEDPRGAARSDGRLEPGRRRPH